MASRSCCRRKSTIAVFGAVLLVSLSASHSAKASPDFPDVIGSYLAAPTPECSVCHSGGVTRRGTVTTLFGAALIERGLVKRDNDALRNALESLSVEAIDNDGDQVTDLDELKAGTDPNAPPGVSSLEPIRYGCGIGAHGRPMHRSHSEVGALGVFFSAFLLGRNFIRRAPTAPSRRSRATRGGA